MEQAGLDENFVRSKGKTNKAIHVNNESAEEDHDSTESETQKRYGDTWMMEFKINVHIIFAVNMCYDYHRAEQICSMQRFNSVLKYLS